MSTPWESCMDHNTRLKSKRGSGKAGKANVKTKNIRITDDVIGTTGSTSFSGALKLLSEANTAVKGI